MDSLDALFNDLESATKDPCDIICEACEEYKGTALGYARALMNAQLLSNEIGRDFKLNLKQAELHCLQCGGTQDDYMLYEDAAEQGAIGKLRAIIAQIIQFWADLCRKTMQIIKTKICTAQAKAAVKKMKNEVRLNSELANKRIQAPDITSALSVIAKYRKLSDINDAKFVRGIFSASPEKGILATVSSFETAFKNATAGAAAVCVLTVGGLIIAIEEEMDKLPRYVTNLETTQSHILDRLSQTISDETAEATTQALQAAMNFRVQLGKQELDTHMTYLKNLISLAKEILANAKGKGDTTINVVESGDEILGVDDIAAILDGGLDDMDMLVAESGDTTQGADTIVEEDADDLDHFLDGVFGSIM